MSLSPHHPLLSDFPPCSPAEWREAAEALLKGASFEKRLTTTTVEGITTQPIYGPADVPAHLDQVPGADQFVRGRRAAGYLGGGWAISQELPGATADAFNAVAVNALQNGQSELNIVLDAATGAGLDPDYATPAQVGARGLSLATMADVRAALRGVALDRVSLYVRSGASGLPVASLLFAYAREQGVPLTALKGCLLLDPLCVLARDGALAMSLPEAWRELHLLTAFCAAEAPGLETIGVRSQPYHDGGCDAVQELGFALATGAEYVRALLARGLPIDTVAPRIRFAFSMGSDFFMEIAKLRAARLAWSSVVAAFGGSPASRAMKLHARTSRWNKTLIDPHVNILRATTEAFSAVLGGCDSLHVAPFDELSGHTDDLSRRLARNTQVILSEECEARRVIDPAGGSYYVEWLTDQVAGKAWTLFQEVERRGGMAAALTAGFPQGLVAAAAEKRLAAVCQRRTTVVGVNNYPNPSESSLHREPPDSAALHAHRAAEMASARSASDVRQDAAVFARLDALSRSAPGELLPCAIEAAAAGASLGEISRTLRSRDGSPAACAAVPARRWSEPYEQLRAACEAARKASGAAPRVFQANIGASRHYRARADWTSNFFTVGGFEVLADRDFESPELAAEAALASGARIAIICSADETYATAVPALAARLDAAGFTVLVAGSPGEHEAAWRAAGVDGFVNVRVDNHELLKGLLHGLGVL
jgi:methylmalonyl-CoA mutase